MRAGSSEGYLNSQSDHPLELWGGHECTVNRVGDQWFDQTVRSGHEHRIQDLSLFAGLGIRKLRYPALWERISPDNPQVRDFSWTDERLAEMRRLGMDPILTLCHHGSGPAYTSLLEESFVTGLAAHAAAVAIRYPWVRHYTPVNEPLTTARFSALYGFWYPHTTDEGAFWTALLNEIDATRFAMREIRKINPDALLVQTDDLGFCHATAPLEAEARFQNERRWMGWDLLCGAVVPGHALWDRLRSFGLEERLQDIADDPCPPDIIGINHYLSSERLLDHRIELHAARDLADRDIGTCGDTRLVDVDAARHVPDDVIGFAGLIEQTWQRYGRPIAITECHLGSTRDDQARWFIDTWAMANELRATGVDLRAVTAWSLLGSYDWNRMVTRCTGHYEPGVFDVRGDQPRPTLVARVIADLAQAREPKGPGLTVPGWWRSEGRNAGRTSVFAGAPGPSAVQAPERLMILKDTGPFSGIAARACEARGLHYVLTEHVDEHVLQTTQPWAILDTRQATCMTGQSAITALCRKLGIIVLVINPVCGTEMPEQSGLLFIRSGPCFTADDDHSWAECVLNSLEAKQRCTVRRDVPHVESYGPSVVDVVLDLLLDRVTGYADLRPSEFCSQATFARTLAAIADAPSELLVELGSAGKTHASRRHSYLPPLETMLERFVRERQASHGERRRALAALRYPFGYDAGTTSRQPVLSVQSEPLATRGNSALKDSSVARDDLIFPRRKGLRR
jgi:dTDP-4-dehydrorhamnose reductase